MARRTCTVEALAVEAGISTDDALLALMEAGLPYESAKQTIWSHHLAIARNLVGASPHMRRSDSTLITELTARAERPIDEVRDVLAKCGLLKKRRLKRIPKHCLRKAEIVLGLVREASGSSPTPELVAARSEHTPQSSDSPRVRKKKARKDWPTIGPKQDVSFLTPKDVIYLHFTLVDDFKKTKDPIDPPGVRSDALLESAVHRPGTALGPDDKYPSVAMAAAALLFGIVLDHPFHNGNKRTALVATLVFLDKNGWVMTCDQDEIYEFLLKLAGHALVDRHGESVVGADNEVIHAANWLQGNIRRLSVRELLLQFRQLRAILETYDCVLDHPTGVGNRVNIRRGNRQTQVAYRNEGFDVEKNTIHKIRRDLELDAFHGYDSGIFYNAGGRIPEFINKYRKVLVRLAKV